MLVQVKYCAQQKYVKLDQVDGRFDFLLFHEKEFSECSLSSASEMSDSSFSSSASTVILEDVPSKRQRVDDTREAVSAKELIETVLRGKSSGEEVLQEYQTTGTIADATRRKMVNILVAHMIDNHGHCPTKAIREEYALGIVMLFPSLKDPYTKKGYEHFYDAASSRGYLSWRLKTVQRKIRRGSAMPPNSPVDLGGPNFQRTVDVERQLDGDACQEAMSSLSHTSDNSLIFQKMRETFQHRQKLVDQDFTLLFDDETSSRLLQKWDVFFKPNVIKEAKRLTATPELRRLMQSAESSPGIDLDEATTYDQEMASLLLLIHLLPPPPGGPKAPKISAFDAVERLVVFHKSCCSLEEHLRNQQGRQPYLLSVGRQKSKIDSFYIAMDKHLISCQANRPLGAFDKLFKTHFVFNLSCDAALVNFDTFLQTTVYNIDVGKMKESPRVRDLRAKLLNQPVQLTICD
ncbi:Replication origin-binding protein [Dissostichus eleginoides]|uniref:Replication origin-binding protein n=1 Tax=Dissostichus eleginoides TaxID=100907 RepID=A0AAD9F9K0_DISEL|nr:Replication origin-binding protein [Dissostichus eleginoides]